MNHDTGKPALDSCRHAWRCISFVRRAAWPRLFTTLFFVFMISLMIGISDVNSLTPGFDGRDVYQRSDGTIETHYPDGRYECKYPDNTVETKYPDGRIETVYPDGRFQTTYPAVDQNRKETWRGVMKGKVTETGTGKPIEETEITLYPKGKPEQPPIQGKGTPDGKYEIPNVPPGEYTAIVKGKCHEKMVQDVIIGSGVNKMDFQAPSKPVRVVTKITGEEVRSLVAGVGFSPSALQFLIYGKMCKAAGVNPENIDWQKTEVVSQEVLSDGMIIVVDFFLRNKSQADSKDKSFCPCLVPTKPAETPSQTTTEKTGDKWVETNKPRGGKPGLAIGPDDPMYNSKGTWGQGYDDQWALKRVGFTPQNNKDSAWNLVGPSPAPVVVAVIDTGIDATHPELAGKLWTNEKEIPGNGKDDDANGYIDDVHGWNFIDKNNDLTDWNGHGTVNAGIIAASINNGIGIAGINPQVRIMPLKALDYDINGGSIETASAIFYAVKNGARVISVSIGGTEYSQFEKEAVDYAHEKGAVVIVAAGNEGVETTESFPAGLEGVITVAATDTTDKRTLFSNWGKGVSIAAPGVDVLSLRAKGTDVLLLSGAKDYRPGFAFIGPDKNYYRATGTSFAVPLVSGVASLILSKNPALTGDQVTNMILNSADDIETTGWDQFTGYGLLNAQKALQADPDYFTSVRVSKITPEKKDGDLVISVYGTAVSSEFKKAWIEMGFGEQPDKWKKVATIKKPVEEGLLAEIKPKEFSKPGQWFLRVMMKTKNHGIKESWGSLNIK